MTGVSDAGRGPRFWFGRSVWRHYDWGAFRHRGFHFWVVHIS
jgi:hypothetical protein